MCYNVFIEYSMDYFIRTVAEMKELTFGEFIRNKREGMGAAYSLRKFAPLCQISRTYLSAIEINREPAPSSDVLDRMAKLLMLDKNEMDIMHELAAASKSAVPSDLTEYMIRPAKATVFQISELC